MGNGKHFYIHSIACFYTFCYIAIVRSTFRKLFEIGRTFSSDLYQHYATHVSPGNVVPSNFQHDLFSRCLTMPNVGREATLISGGRETVQHPPSSSLPSPFVGSSLVGRRRERERVAAYGPNGGAPPKPSLPFRLFFAGLSRWGEDGGARKRRFSISQSSIRVCAGKFLPPSLKLPLHILDKGSHCTPFAIQLPDVFKRGMK